MASRHVVRDRMVCFRTGKINNILKKGNLILTGAYGPPIPINDKKLIEVTSSLFGNVSAVFK